MQRIGQNIRKTPAIVADRLMPDSLRKLSTFAVLAVQAWIALIGMAHHEPLPAAGECAQACTILARDDAGTGGESEACMCLVCMFLVQDKWLSARFEPAAISQVRPLPDDPVRSIRFLSNTFAFVPRGPPPVLCISVPA